METFSASLAICAGYLPVPVKFPTQRQVMHSFNVFCDLRLNKQLSKQSWGWWFEMLSRPVWRRCNVVGYFDETLPPNGWCHRLCEMGWSKLILGIDYSFLAFYASRNALWADMTSGNVFRFRKALTDPCTASTTAWWRQQMEIFSALLGLCADDSPVTCEFPSQRPVTRTFGAFFDLCLYKQLSKQSRRRWFETPSRILWRHCNG